MGLLINTSYGKALDGYEGVKLQFSIIIMESSLH